MTVALTNALHEALSTHDLQVMGGFAITPDDGLTLHSGTLILIGPNEPHFWATFRHSAEYHDREPDPLDRWSRERLDPIAAHFDGQALYPFGGPPHAPFYTWAVRTGQSWPSPIGFLVHQTAGLFASYRGALVVPWQTTFQQDTSPCATCAGQPCKTACPVDAFTDGYDVDKCRSHLTSPEGSNCMTSGCRARRACPIGQGNRMPAQAAFHMKAFL